MICRLTPELERHFHPKSNRPVAAILNLRICESGVRTHETSIFQERVDARVVGMIEGIYHAHVPDETNTLAPVARFRNLEVCGVRSVIAQAVAPSITIGRARDDLRLTGVRNEMHLVGLNHAGCACPVQLPEVNQGGGSCPATHRISVKSARIDGINTDRGSGRGKVGEERARGLVTAIERSVEAVVESVISTRRRAEENLRRSVCLPRLQDVTASQGPSSKNVPQDATLRGEERQCLVE
jgi:hypothetical protein